MSQAIRRERERCCDDVAVSLCGDRFVYVKALTAMEALRGRAPGLAMAAGSRGGPLRWRVLRLLGVPHEPAPIAARWLAAAAASGRGDRRSESALPWSATAADAPPSSPLAGLSRDQIPAYELKVAGAADPANASPSLVAILGDSRLKMMEYVGSMVFTPDGREPDQRRQSRDRVLGPAHRRARAQCCAGIQTVSMPWPSAGTGGRWYRAATTAWSRSGTLPPAKSGSRSRVIATLSPPWPSARMASLSPRATTRSGLWDISAGRQHVHMKLLGRASADRSTRWPSAPTAGRSSPAAMTARSTFGT